MFSIQVTILLCVHGFIRLTTSVPVSASFIELDAATALHCVSCSYSDYQFIKERNYDM